MRLAIALFTLALSVSSGSPHTLVTPKVTAGSEFLQTSVVAKVKDPEDKVLVKPDTSWTSEAKTVMAQVGQYGFDLLDQKIGLRNAQKVISSYYKEFTDSPGKATANMVASVGHGLWGGAVTISQTMGALLIDLSNTVSNIYWFEDNSVFACARRGSEPLFASVKQYTLAKGGHIRPIRLRKLGKDEFSSIDEESPIKFSRDSSPYIDKESGIELFVFTSSENPPKKYIIVNLENSGSGFEAVERSELLKSIKLYTTATDINGREVLTEIKPFTPARGVLGDGKPPELTYKDDQTVVLKLERTSECVDGLKAKLKKGIENVDRLNTKLKWAVKHASDLKELSTRSTRPSPEKRTSGDTKKGKGAGTKKPSSRFDTQASKKKTKDFSSDKRGTSTAKGISKRSSGVKKSARAK